MNEFQRKKRLHRMLYSKVSITLLAILTILIIRGSIAVVQKERQSRKNLEKVEAELIVAKEREKTLEEDIKTLSTPTGIESEIRSKYNVRKEGEDVIIVVEPESQEDSSSTESSFWSKIRDWFKGLFK